MSINSIKYSELNFCVGINFMVKKVNKTIDQPHENHCSYNEIVVIEMLHESN